MMWLNENMKLNKGNNIDINTLIFLLCRGLPTSICLEMDSSIYDILDGRIIVLILGNEGSDLEKM